MTRKELNSKAANILRDADVQQARHHWINGQAKCAAQVLKESLGVNEFSMLDWFDMSLPTQRCPKCGEMRPCVVDLVIHLNDDHGASFHDIADQLDSVVRES